MLTAGIIISAKGSAAWLSQCVESVVCQRLPPFWRKRILLGIDACPATLAVAKTLDVPDMVVAYFPEHIGPYVIFNSLAYSELTDVLIRFDADDVMLDGYLNAQLELLHPDLPPTLTQTWSTYVDPQLRPISARLADGSLTRSDGRRPRPSDGQFLITRSLLNRLGGFQPWWCHADTEFIRRATWSRASRRIVKDYLYLRRVHPDSLTQSSMTGYGSPLREHYSQQIAEARQRYARGITPAWIHPIVKGYFSETQRGSARPTLQEGDIYDYGGDVELGTTRLYRGEPLSIRFI
jgi:hypothetical protein